MEYINESDLSSESEDEINILIRKDIKIPDEFSVDNLLRERAKNPIIPRSQSFKESSLPSTVNPQGNVKIEQAFTPPMNIENFYTKDGCIFKTVNNQFPFFIFKVLEINENEEESNFLSYKNTMPKYLIKCMQSFPQQVPPSPEIFLSYAHYLASNNILDSQMILFKYSQLLQQQTIDYKMWRCILIY